MGLKSRIIADGMLRTNTPVQDYKKEFGLLVKREDLACPPPGPPFSKTRGVYARVKSRPEKVIGVLDTYHSQAGHAVARACQVLGKKCVNFYPVYKADKGLREPQKRSQALDASLVGLPAGRSCILFHAAKKLTAELDGYMMPNALKLDESVDETAREVDLGTRPSWVIIPASSGTIAAGVIKGFGDTTNFIIHLGYSRSHDTVRKYIEESSGVKGIGKRLIIIDEGYQYKDKAKDGPTPPWPCNEYYDLKAFRWWMQNRDKYQLNNNTLFWNVG